MIWWFKEKSYDNPRARLHTGPMSIQIPGTLHVHFLNISPFLGSIEMQASDYAEDLLPLDTVFNCWKRTFVWKNEMCGWENRSKSTVNKKKTPLVLFRQVSDRFQLSHGAGDGCCQSLQNMDRWDWPCTLQGMAGNLFLLLDRWNPERPCEIVKLALRNSSALSEPRDVTWKIWWPSLSKCFYESANIYSTDLTNRPNGNALGFHTALHLHMKNSMLYIYVLWITVSGRSPSFHCLRTCISWSSIFHIFFSIVFVVLSLDLPCNCIQCYSRSFICLAFWLCKHM